MSYLREVPLDENEFPPYKASREQFGFIPNLFRAQTLRPDIVEAEAGLVFATLLKDGALSRRQKEYIFLVSSAANLSTYCVTAHCEIVRALGLRGPEPEQIAIDHPNADIPQADKALLDFALKLTRKATKVSREDIETLRRHGFKDEHVLEAIVVVGVAKFANLLAHGLGAAPDFEPKFPPLKD